MCQNVNNKLAAEIEKTDSVKWNRRKTKIQQRLFPMRGACTLLQSQQKNKIFCAYILNPTGKGSVLPYADQSQNMLIFKQFFQMTHISP